MLILILNKQEVGLSSKSRC